MRMSYTLNCNHRDVIPKKRPALHECTDAYRHMHGQAGPYISMWAPDMTRVVPNVNIVTPKIVALTNGQRLSSNLEEENRV